MNKQEVIDKFKEYVNTYKPEHCVDEECFVADMLYGIGVALLDEKYRWASGFDQFCLDYVKKRVDRAEKNSKIKKEFDEKLKPLKNDE